MEDRLQHQPTAHEPARAHTNRVRSTPQGGAKLEQTLLMNEDKLGSRSAIMGKSHLLLVGRAGTEAKLGFKGHPHMLQNVSVSDRVSNIIQFL